MRPASRASSCACRITPSGREDDDLASDTDADPWAESAEDDAELEEEIAEGDDLAMSDAEMDARIAELEAKYRADRRDAGRPCDDERP